MKIEASNSGLPRFTRGAVILMAAIGTMVVDVPVEGASPTTAYWRFEEGQADSLVPDGNDTVLDQFEDENHLRTFSSPSTAPMYTEDVSPLPLRSGLSNVLSLDFGPNSGGGGLNNDIYADGKDINTASWTELTIELAFKMNAIGGFQALVGKDGTPLMPGSPVPMLKIMVRGDDIPNDVDNQLFVEWIDGNGVIQSLAGGSTIEAGQWYHMAFVVNASDAELWVAEETTPYSLVDSITGNFAGPDDEVTHNTTGTFTVGRGRFGNSNTDWADAIIDEVRISDDALSPNEFLFIAIPEPGSFVLAVAGMAWLGTRRRRY